MFIFLLQRYKGADYCEYNAHVIQAETESRARQMAEDIGEPDNCWLSDEKVVCQCYGKSVIAFPKEEIILSDYKEG